MEGSQGESKGPLSALDRGVAREGHTGEEAPRGGCGSIREASENSAGEGPNSIRVGVAAKQQTSPQLGATLECSVSQTAASMTLGNVEDNVGGPRIVLRNVNNRILMCISTFCF